MKFINNPHKKNYILTVYKIKRLHYRMVGNDVAGVFAFHSIVVPKTAPTTAIVREIIQHFS
jgi:hypothetical protein